MSTWGRVVAEARARRCLLLALLAVVALPTAGGCSYAFVQGPPPNHERSNYFECSAMSDWPSRDVVQAVPWGLLTLLGTGGTIAAASEGTTSTGAIGGLAGLTVAMGAITAVYIASAVYGFRTMAACREAKARLMDRVMAHRPAAAVAEGGADVVGGEGMQCTWVLRPTYCQPGLTCRNNRCVSPPPRVARAPASMPRQVPASLAAEPVTDVCEVLIKDLCACVGPPARVVARACIDAERARSAYGEGSECRAVVRRLRRGLPCAAAP